MRRPALLAFGFFAIAASLPAEVRECLPMSAACEHRAARVGSACARPAKGSPCRRAAQPGPASCPKAQPTPDTTHCRLHPTPPVVLSPPAALASPAVVVIDLVEPIAAPDAVRASRAGWRDAPVLQPRASPCSTPLSPRPPPFTV